MSLKKIKQYIALRKRKLQNQKLFSDKASTHEQINDTSTELAEQPAFTTNNRYSHTKTILSNNKFQKAPVSQLNMLTAGSVLAQRRKELGVSIKRIASDTKIQEKYLQDIENNKFEGFESAVFLNGFIKIYADYLDLDVNKVSALFRRQIKDSQKNETTVIAPINNKTSKLLTPNNVIIAMSILFFVIIGGYISFQFANFRKAPHLEITHPENQTSSEVKEFQLKGLTEEATSIFVNDTEINVDEEFRFITTVTLREGSNTITIEAIKKSNQQNVSTKTLSVDFNPNPSDTKAEVKKEKVVIPDSYTVKVETLQAEVWLILNIDGKQELAQILARNQIREFEFTEEIYLSTGRPTSTKLYVNDEEVTLNIDSTTGTGKVTCSIRSDGYSCN
jgi:cytoskeletal protein RodZ